MHKSIVLYLITAMVLLTLLTGCKTDAGLIADPENTPGNAVSTSEPPPDYNANDAVFSPDRHNRNDSYAATFNTYSATLGGITLHVRDRIYDETTARDILSVLLNIHGSVEAIQPGFARDICVYVVDSTLTGSVVTAEKKVFLTADDINADDGYRGIVSVLTGVTEPWQAVGLAGYIRGDKPDEHFLRAFYSDESNQTILSLFAAYFVPEFTNEDTARAALETAVCLTKLILSEYDFEEYLAEAYSTPLRQKWLEQLGVGAEYQSSYDFSIFKSAGYTSSKDYPLIITFADVPHIFYFKHVPDFTETPEEIIELLFAYHNGMERILTKTRDNAPSAYGEVLQNWEKPLHIRCDGVKNELSYASGDRQIKLNAKDALWHEICHMLLPEVDLDWQVWLSEGFAMYLAATEESIFLGESISIVYGYYLNDEEYLDLSEYDDMEFRSLIKRYYLSHDALPTTADEFDIALFYEAVGAIVMVYPELKENNPLHMASATLLQVRFEELAEGPGLEGMSNDGQELTYPEAYVLTKYVVEKHGLDEVMTAYLSRTRFEEAFGWSFYNALEECRQALRESLELII